MLEYQKRSISQTPKPAGINKSEFHYGEVNPSTKYTVENYELRVWVY